MAEAMAAMGQGAVPPPQPDRSVYAASGGRKLAFSFVFLILLPFFASLPAMLFWRVSQGHWVGTFGLLVLALGFSVIMLLVVIELIQSLRARVELGDTAVKMTLPSGRGPTPMLRYRSHEVPYDQIKAVETRGEVYGSSVAPVLLKGARLILKDDSAVKLGYVSEANMDPCFPYPEIAEKIAARAGVPVEHRGCVRRSAQKKFLGLKREFINEPEQSVGDYEMVVLNNQHQRWVMRLIWLLAGLVVLGIAMDIIFPPSSGLPPALTSLKSFVTGGPSSAPVDKKAK
jgi:hypothetical protein